MSETLVIIAFGFVCAVIGMGVEAWSARSAERLMGAMFRRHMNDPRLRRGWQEQWTTATASEREEYRDNFRRYGIESEMKWLTESATL